MKKIITLAILLGSITSFSAFSTPTTYKIYINNTPFSVSFSNCVASQGTCKQLINSTTPNRKMKIFETTGKDHESKGRFTISYVHEPPFTCTVHYHLTNKLLGKNKSTMSCADPSFFCKINTGDQKALSVERCTITDGNMQR